MGDVEILVENIRQIIKDSVSPVYENTSRTELYVRCPECGDSKHSKSSAHFYIQMKPPFRCYCHKCGYSGVLNQELLERLSIFNNNVVLNINEANKDNKNTQQPVYRSKTEVLTIEEELNERTQASLDYFNTRFGTEFDISTLNNKFKCVCNPESVLKDRGVDYSRSKLDFSKSIGFLSSDSKYLICRDNTGTQACRYANMPLSLDEDKSKIYNIRTKVNILNDETTLVITEGIFDAIGIYLKLYQGAENVIIAAACGKSSYSQVIDKFIKMGFLNLKVIIYSDADVCINTFADLKKKNMYIKNNTIEVYYNTLEKDCGVSADRIELKKYTV